MLLILALFILLAGEAHAALTCADANAVTFFDSTPQDPETISYTTPAGTNQITFVLVGQRTGTAPRTHTATLGGVSMTQATTEAYQDPIGAALYKLVNPPSGTNNLVVDWNNLPLADAIIIFTCNDTDTTGFRSTNQAQGTGTAVSVTPSTALAGDIVVDCHASESASTPTVGANQTVIASGNAGAEISGGCSYQDGSVSPAAMTWTILSNDWGTGAVVIKALTGSTRRFVAPMEDY